MAVLLWQAHWRLPTRAVVTQLHWKTCSTRFTQLLTTVAICRRSLSQRTISTRARSHDDYTIACICPMGVELAPVEGMLDEIHEPLPTSRDQNAYTLGRIAGHNMVIAVMPEVGNEAAATVATQLLNDFSAVRFGLLVGIGGGVPGEADVRLGDVVVSQPTNTFGGVVQYDLGKRLVDGVFQRTGLLNKPPAVLSTNVRKLQAQHLRTGCRLSTHISSMIKKYPNMHELYSMPTTEKDQLFLASYQHQAGGTCDQCDSRQMIDRTVRSDREPRIHYGTIGSANIVVKDPTVRDELGRDMNVLCVEMEAAGLMNSFPCLVVRGICDYADSHKNKRWQPYAAATAAAYMKELLTVIPVQQVAQTQNAIESTASSFELGSQLGKAPAIHPNLFIGRQLELKEMADILMPTEKSHEQHRLVLGGMGGIGKTQLAIAYAKRYNDLYDSIFWLNATSEVSLKASLQSMAECILEADEYEKLEQKQIFLRVRQWLSQPQNTKWLLIFDNYDDPDIFDIQTYCPSVDHGTIILTTRLPDRVGGRQIQLQPFKDVGESLQVLETTSKRADVQDDRQAYHLAKRLDGHPLALATVGFYLLKSNTTFDQYLKAYEKRWNIDPKRTVKLSEYSDRTLYTTWDISFQHLQKSDPEAAELLKLLAYFDNQCIWFELLRAGVTPESPAWLTNVTADVVNFDSMMRVLVEYFFIDVQETRASYSMHNCVHDWISAQVNQSDDVWKYWYAFDCVAKLIENEDRDSLDRPRFALLAPHAVRLTRSTFHSIINKISEDHIDGAEDIGELLREQNQFVACEILTCIVLAHKEATLGAEHQSTLVTMDNLGLLHAEQEKLSEAETMFGRALAGQEKALGPKHITTLGTVNNLGNLYLQQSKPIEAEAMYLRVLAGIEEALGPDDTWTLNILQSLGLTYRDQCKLDEAEATLVRALAGCENAFGHDHPSTLFAVDNLGLVYLDQNRWDEANSMFVRALVGIEKMFGPNHTRTLATVHHLGRLYRYQCRPEDAEQMLERALAGREKILGPDHKLTLETVTDLGNLYSEQDKLNEAVEMYERALDGYNKTLGPTHKNVLNLLADYGILFSKQHRFNEAEQVLQRILSARERLLGSDHISTLEVVTHLGTVYFNQNKLNEAERMYERALGGYRRQLGQEQSEARMIADQIALIRKMKREENLGL